jgi:type I restriction enzyme M protein
MSATETGQTNRVFQEVRSRILRGALTRFFPEGKDSKKRRYQDYRWKSFKNFEPRDMYTVVSEHVFPWLRTLGGFSKTR